MAKNCTPAPVRQTSPRRNPLQPPSPRAPFVRAHGSPCSMGGLASLYSSSPRSHSGRRARTDVSSRSICSALPVSLFVTDSVFMRVYIVCASSEPYSSVIHGFGASTSPKKVVKTYRRGCAALPATLAAGSGKCKGPLFARDAHHHSPGFLLERRFPILRPIVSGFRS